MGKDGARMAESPEERRPVRWRAGELHVLEVAKTSAEGRGEGRGEVAKKSFVSMPVLGNKVQE